MSMKEWAEREVEIACRRELQKDGAEADYGCGCYQSALKAYKSLMADGHSGMSFSITKNILERMMDGKPLTPIEDTDAVWNYCYEGEGIHYQCNRMSSLFKTQYADGTVKYNDINRYICIDINNPDFTYHSSLVDEFMDEIFPITLPYYPQKSFRVYCEEFLTDEKNGDFDTVGILYAVKPDGNKVDIYKYFKEMSGEWVAIGVEEYVNRKDKKIK